MRGFDINKVVILKGKRSITKFKLIIMEISIFLAKFWGWLLVIICLIFLLRKKVLLEEVFRLVEDKSFALFSGYLALIVGLVTVILHNLWVADWRVVITIFGWTSLIKGIVRISFPEIPQKLVPTFKNKPGLTQILLIIAILLGAWLIWMSC